MTTYEYRESDKYYEQISANTLYEALGKARDLLTTGDWSHMDAGDTIRAHLAVLDDDGDQIDLHTVTATVGDK